MGKRRGENRQLRKEELDALENEECSTIGTFKKADAAKLKKRRIVKVRKARRVNQPGRPVSPRRRNGEIVNANEFKKETISKVNNINPFADAGFSLTQSSKPNSSAVVDIYKSKLVAFYTKHAPEKLSTVDSVLSKYRGHETVLFERLSKKYNSGNNNDVEHKKTKTVDNGTVDIISKTTETTNSNSTKKLDTTTYKNKNDIYLYHLVEKSLWKQLTCVSKSNDKTTNSSQEYFPPTYKKDGFTHLCKYPEQLIDIANTFYKDIKGDFQVLCIDQEKISGKVKFEPAAAVGEKPVDEKKKGFLYPHLYSGIRIDSVVKVLDVERHSNGNFVSVIGI